jgi:hypothetical protein
MIADSGVGPNNVLTLGLSIVLIVIALLHSGKAGKVYSIPCIVLSAIALLVSLATLLETWGIDIRYVQADEGVGPYLSAIGAAVALYGSRRKAEMVIPQGDDVRG